MRQTGLQENRGRRVEKDAHPRRNVKITRLTEGNRKRDERLAQPLRTVRQYSRAPRNAGKGLRTRAIATDIRERAKDQRRVVTAIIQTSVETIQSDMFLFEVCAILLHTIEMEKKHN